MRPSGAAFLRSRMEIGQHMTMRTRKLIGTILLLVMITVYSLLAMMVAVVLEVNTTSEWVELVYYAVAGLLWVVPAAWIVWWMSREDGD